MCELSDAMTDGAALARALVGSDELVRLLVDSTAEGMLGLDVDGKFIFANRAALRLLGFSDEADLLGRDGHQLIHHTRSTGEPCPVEECEISRAFREEREVHVADDVMWRADGSCFDAEYRSHPLRRDRTLIGCVVNFVDITERRRNEKLLVEQAAGLTNLARFAELNPGPVLRLDLEATILLANPAAEDVFGRQLLGRCWRDVCPGIDGETWAQMVDAQDSVMLEARVGDREFLFTHHHDAVGDLVFVYGADITRQKQAERGLRQSEKMATLGTLAAGVAHELNNPAAATRRAADQLRVACAKLEETHLVLEGLGLGASQLELLRALEAKARRAASEQDRIDALSRSDLEMGLQEWLEDEGVNEAWSIAPPLVELGIDRAALSEIRQVLGTDAFLPALTWITEAFRIYGLAHEIGQGSERMSEIVGALKDYSYLGQAPVQLVDVHEAIENTLVILNNRLKAGISVRREYGALPRVPAYGSELNQVWTNLIDNAADAMAGRGTITIRTRREDPWAVVEVEDDGPGIPEELQSQVFDPFFTTKDPGKGTGLGLSTTYGIIAEKHGGQVGLESRPGCTRFTVKLPLAEQGKAT